MNKKTTIKQDNFRFFKEEIDIDEDIKEGMYQQLIKNMAKEIDIDFAKTPLVDLLTGYKKYKILEDKINKVNSMIDEISKSGYEYKGTYYSPIPLKYCDVLLVIKEILGDKE